MIDESWYKRPTDVQDRTSAGGVVARDSEMDKSMSIGELGLTERVLPNGGVEPGESKQPAGKSTRSGLILARTDCRLRAPLV